MERTALKIKKGDKVKVVAGKDKGKEGAVEKVLIKKKKAIVAGVNIYKKHARARRQGEKGGIIDVVKPLPVSSLVLICPKCGQTTRVIFRVNGQKVRVCKKCQEVI